VFHDQAGRFGNGTAYFADDYRSARRPLVGRKQPWPRRYIPIHRAGRYGRTSVLSEAQPVVHLVDDDASFLKAMSRLLRAEKFQVQSYSSATDFLARRPRDTPGCVVVDLQMPGLDGLDLQRQLVNADDPIPLVFLTGQGDIPSSVRAMRQGAEDFLTKRAPKAEILTAVRQALA